MVRKRLSAEDEHLWARVSATVSPLPGKVVRKAAFLPASVNGAQPLRTPPRPLAKTPEPAKAKPRQGNLQNTLDANWDRKLSKGATAPDRTIDLHGHTAAYAHQVLDIALDQAIRGGARIVLVITGKSRPENPRLPPTSRGVIRASIGDWLAASRHAPRIAAVRNAHPRHGGAGALYVILRRNTVG